MARQGQVAALKAKQCTSGREAHWRQALADWGRSGLSKVAFCRERGLSASAFHWWKGELVRRDAARRSRLSRPSSAKGREAKAKPAFVAVRLAEGAVDRHAERGCHIFNCQLSEDTSVKPSHASCLLTSRRPRR